MASALGPCQWTPCPIFHPRNFNTQLVPVEEANLYMSGTMSEGAGRELRDALVVWSDERAPYNLIIAIFCVECGANFHVVSFASATKLVFFSRLFAQTPIGYGQTADSIRVDGFFNCYHQCFQRWKEAHHSMV